jgi:hypothetical protein
MVPALFFSLPKRSSNSRASEGEGKGAQNKKDSKQGQVTKTANAPEKEETGEDVCE